jgi:hypothetical protein
MSLLGGLLPGLLSAINPANILRGVVNTATGILSNISKGQPVDISGNLARGLKTVIGEDQSALGSIGGSNIMEPQLSAKLDGIQNAANRYNIPRMHEMAKMLKKSISSNAANHLGVWSEDRTKSSNLGSHPVNELVALKDSIESAPGGMPDRRITLGHTGMKQIPMHDLLGGRDQYGYKSPPVVMQGISSHESKEPKVKMAHFKMKK